MRRKDMSKETLYAIEVNGVWRPGYVLDPGAHPGPVRVKVWWKWGTRMDEEWLNPQPNLLSAFAKSETHRVTTAEVREPWADWCSKRLAANAAKLAELEEAEAERQRSKADLIKRIDGVAALLDANNGQYIDAHELVWAAKSDHLRTIRYSAKDVLDLVEAIAHKFDMVERVEREGQ